MTAEEYKKIIKSKKEQYESLKDKAKSARQGADAILRLNAMTALKEKDWAIAGGIASGIAGSAAGLATALDV